MSSIISSLHVNSNLYKHYLTLSDHLIRAVATCMIDKLSNEDIVIKKKQADLIRSSGKAYTLNILKRAPERARTRKKLRPLRNFRKTQTRDNVP